MDTVGASYRPVEFTAEDDITLTGVLKPGRSDSPALLLFPGNAGNLTGRIWWLELVPPPGWTALIFDYRGYGLSEGKPSEQGLYRDVEAAVNFLKKQTEGPLFYHGRSLGSVMATHAAAYHRPAGIILESGFPNAAAMARVVLPVPGIEKLLRVNFNSLENLARAEKSGAGIDKLIIHGTADRVVPPALGRLLYQKSDQPKQRWFVEGAGHNNLPWFAGEQIYAGRIRDFLTETTAKQ